MKNKTISIGHRGAKGHFAENTIQSIEKAIELGAQMVEFDVHKCSSGEIVLMHDTTLNRTTNGKGKISDYTYKQLTQYKVAGEYAIPTLQDVLNTVKKKVALNIELKGKSTASNVSFILNRYIQKTPYAPDDFLVSSFNWEELKKFKLLSPQIPVAVLTESNPEEAILFAKEINAVAIHIDYNLLSEPILKKMHQEGFKVHVFTVNKPKDIARFKEWEVDGIITDYPERVHEN